MEHAEKYETWCILEMLGHKRMAGYLTEQSIAGSSLLRVDVPATDADARYGYASPATEPYTKLVGVGSVYAITPCTENVARRAAREIERGNDPIPVTLPKMLPASTEATAEHVHVNAWDGDEEDDSVYADESEGDDAGN